MNRPSHPSSAGPRSRGIAMLLVLFTLAMGVVLALPFLAAQSTTLGIAENAENHLRARGLAESALEIGVDYVRTDAAWRTTRTHGTWMSAVPYQGGVLTLQGFDGFDANRDGSIAGAETDGSLSDSAAEPITLVATGAFGGATHAVRGVMRFVAAGTAADPSLEPTDPTRVFFVRTTGNNANNGRTPATAWRTIHFAATNAAVTSGSTIYIGAGSYDERVAPTVQGTLSAPIRFIGDTSGAKTGDAGVVAIRRSGDYALVVNRHHLHFRNLRIHASMGVFWDTADNGLLWNCTVDNNTDDGINIDKGASLVIHRSRIHSNAKNGIHFTHPKDQVTVSASEIYANSDNGIQCDKGWINIYNSLIRNNVAMGVYFKSNGGGRIEHCTIAANNSSGVKQEGDTVVIVNSIIANNLGKGVERGGGTMTRSHNVVFGNVSGNFQNTPQQASESTANPRFVSPTDFRLQAGSPAINSTVAASTLAFDLDARARPQGSTRERGCYEFGSTPFGTATSSSTTKVQWVE